MFLCGCLCPQLGCQLAVEGLSSCVPAAATRIVLGGGVGVEGYSVSQHLLCTYTQKDRTPGDPTRLRSHTRECELERNEVLE